ncbi:MAG: AraC family transcriptional regulator [Streptosporangiaceae bacterium]|jgi:AraC-like DNA-binding protein
MMGTLPPDRPAGLEETRPRGVLRPAQWSRAATLRKLTPVPEVARFVEFYWWVRWEGPYETNVLAHPNVHLVFEEPAPLVYGVDRGLFTRKLAGTGQVLGVKFRPGWFRPFIDGPVSRLADRRLPAADFFSGVHNGVIWSSGDPASAADEFLLPRLPASDPLCAEAEAIVGWITGSAETFRVDDVAREFGTSVRSLQRLFAEYVGASPKWVLRRARLHEAAARADSGAVDWATLAAELGYADQPHFVRDFTGAVGVPPSRYVVQSDQR